VEWRTKAEMVSLTSFSQSDTEARQQQQLEAGGGGFVLFPPSPFSMTVLTLCLDSSSSARAFAGASLLA